MFKRVCIIGCGLIGSSIARGIKKNKLARKVVSSNRSKATNKKIMKLNIVDEASSDTKKIVKGSDLIIIATPLSSYNNVVLKLPFSSSLDKLVRSLGFMKLYDLSLDNK